MIDIIIPVYNSKMALENALLSILFQSIKDKINLYIIDDNSMEDYTEILSKFQNYLKITYYKNIENIGAGLSRQKGLELSNSKYVVFLDSDDLFYTHTSIEELFNAIKINNYDYVSSMTYNEKNKANCDNIGDLHGKIYRRKFLEEHNIKFNDFRYDEDNFFNTLVLMHNPLKAAINQITYIYKNNPNSLTNHYKNIQIAQIENYVKSIWSALEQSITSKNYNKNVIKSILNEKVNYLKYIRAYFSYEDKMIINNWIDEFCQMF